MNKEKQLMELLHYPYGKCEGKIEEEYYLEIIHLEADFKKAKEKLLDFRVDSIVKTKAKRIIEIVKEDKISVCDAKRYVRLCIKYGIDDVVEGRTHRMTRNLLKG